MVTRRVRVVVASLTKFVEDIVKAIVSNVTNGLVATTPVDTGWAQANWIPKIGSAFRGMVGSKKAVSRAAQLSGLVTVITSYTIRQKTVHITNNVPHIIPLNEGSSRKAPSGFVQIAIARSLRVGLPASLGA